MSKYEEPVLPDPGQPSFARDLITALGTWSLNLRAILDKGISIDHNVDADRLSVKSSATPGAEFSVAHQLGKVPAGYLVTGQDGPGHIYAGSTPNTKTTLYFKSDQANVTFSIMVF